MRVFFAQDHDDTTWSVVIQKEPRSRRIQDNVDEPGIIAAPGYDNPITWDESNSPLLSKLPYDALVGVQVAPEDVAMVEACREPHESRTPYVDMDWVDDDDDDDMDCQDVDLMVVPNPVLHDHL